MKTKKRKTIIFRLEEELYYKLTAVAKHQDINLSEAIRQVILNGIPNG